MWSWVCVLATAWLAAGDRLALPRCTTKECMRRYDEMRDSHPPSPRQLAEDSAARQKAKGKAVAAHEVYVHSEAHHMDMVRAGNRMVQNARQHPLGAETDGRGVRCGSRVPVSHLGLKSTDSVRSIFRTALLQDRAGNPSMAGPKAGATQTLKDEGTSTMGVVVSADKDLEVEPYVKVFKDGFSNVGCVKDDMYDYGDKYGDNGDKYRMGDSYNVSIVKYKEVVLREKQQAMSPQHCYEFCRSVPDMVYFGIRSGTDCYCTPFFQKAESSSEACDMPCLGDPTMMCGGQSEKSSVFEMHMCADTAGDILYASVNAEVALVYFYDTAFMTDRLADHLQKNGETLQEVAGEIGDQEASDLAQEAKKEAGSLKDPNTGWGKCRGSYETLLKVYKDAEPLHKADFSFAKELQKAEYTITTENQLKTKLTACAVAAETPILAVYPFFNEFMDALDEQDLQAKSDKYGKALVSFHPLLYTLDSDATPAMSSCSGKLLGRPMPLPLAGCAAACSRMNTRPRCTAFQFFQFMDGEKQRPLCFLFSSLRKARSYKCDMLPESLLQGASASERALRGQKAASDAEPLCAEIGRIRRFSGLSCESIFGKKSELIKGCPAECKEGKGAQHTALCMANVLTDKPRVKVKASTRCFGKDNGEASQSNADFRVQEFGTDASGGAGPLIEGEIKMGDEVVAEPYEAVWTPGPAGQR